MSNEINELSIDELDTVSGGGFSTTTVVAARRASALCSSRVNVILD